MAVKTVHVKNLCSQSLTSRPQTLTYTVPGSEGLPCPSSRRKDLTLHMFMTYENRIHMIGYCVHLNTN